MFAVVKVAGKQFVTRVGKQIKIDAEIIGKDNKIKLDEVLFLANDKDVKIGKPNVDGANVDAEIITSGKGKKVLVVKHHPKKRFRKNVGHRQDQTTLKILKINEK